MTVTLGQGYGRLEILSFFFSSQSKPKRLFILQFGNKSLNVIKNVKGIFEREAFQLVSTQKIGNISIWKFHHFWEAFFN